ncbi:hypothetical protein ACVWYG_002574 [Pedobacter sp. UYEF25]
MKTILLALIVVLSISTTCLAQNNKENSKITQVEKIKNKVKVWFKSSYVAENFKDPYSYKLLKFELSPISKKDYLINEIATLSVQTNEDNKVIIDTYKEMIQKGTKEYLSKIDRYYIYLDAYGKNSYGANVLGKYRFLVDPNGVLIGKVVDMND